MAASFAVEQAHRLRKLELVIAPAGLKVPGHETTTICFACQAEQLLPGYLVENMEVLLPHLPTGHDVDFIVGGYREMTSGGRGCCGNGPPYDAEAARNGCTA